MTILNSIYDKVIDCFADDDIFDLIMQFFEENNLDKKIYYNQFLFEEIAKVIITTRNGLEFLNNSYIVNIGCTIVHKISESNVKEDKDFVHNTKFYLLQVWKIKRSKFNV